MQLEDYLDFIEADVIRLKGRRIGLEHIVERYQEGLSPEQIAAYFGDLSLEQVYAVITYYLHNQSDVDAYLARLDRFVESEMRRADANPSPTIQRLRALKQRQREPSAT